jgi:hypothetical protein
MMIFKAYSTRFDAFLEILKQHSSGVLQYTPEQLETGSKNPKIFQ